jgi:uncharacterized membrane protein YbhN (UPF0104 family)
MLNGQAGGMAPHTPRQRARAVLRVAVTLALLTALFFAFGLSPRRLAGAVGDADGALLGVALAMLCLLLALLCLKWYVIAGGLRIRATLLSSGRLYLVGMVLNTVLPTAIGGDAYRVYSLSREADVSFHRPLVSVIIERASGYAGLLALSAAAAALYFLGGVLGAAVAIAVLSMMAVVYAALRRLAHPADALNDEPWTWRRWWRLPFTRPTLDLIAALSILQQALWISVAAVFGLAYDASVPWTYWALTVTALTLLTVAPVSVGGLGLREIGYVALLKPLDVDAHQAAAVGLAMGFAPALLSLVLLLPFMAGALRPRATAALPEVAPSERPTTPVER